jgi:DNA processing protein
LPRTEKAARWTLWGVRGIAYRRMARLVDETGGDIASLYGQDDAWLEDVLAGCGISRQVRRRARAKLAEADPQQAYAGELERLPAHTKLLHLGEPGYPPRLVDLEDPPVFLYVRGELGATAGARTVAIVGSRKTSVRGCRLARSVARQLAEAGVVVVSGGALGVDASAHRGCLEADQPTAVVLAGGVERPTPRKNFDVFEAATEQGALVSEYPIGAKPRRYHFQRRNSLIAALGDATLVVRAGQKSGTMITARAAARLGRPLGAIPGPLDEPLTAGCHQLLVEGAQCVRGADDVLEHLLGAAARTDSPQEELFVAPAPAASHSPAPAAAPAAKAEPVDVSDDARRLLEEMGELAAKRDGRVVHADDLKRSPNRGGARVDALLLELELTGAITKRPGANAYEL